MSQLRKYTKPGGIILLHDRNVRTIKAVSRMLPVWREWVTDSNHFPPAS